ncbi:MAG: hypothetical protein QOJ65_967, partial [Fimbriimonadaceae bacterium]|nr:hypothetical protein [Fimbriimonadaceae bacterium]
TLLGEHDWTHRDHVATAAYYCLTDPDCAADRMRAGIQALNKARGVETTPTGGYHETLTIAWTRIIAGHLRNSQAASNLDRVNDVIASFEDRKTTLRYYSRDRIMSLEARFGWVEPDLEALP